MSVRHALLALLSEEPKFGQQLQQEFEARTGETWPLNVGQVYTTLQRLERDRLVVADDAGVEQEGRRKRYRLTAEGAQVLDAWLRSPADLSPPPRDELLIKILVAVGLASVDVHEVIQAHRRQLVQEMQRYTRLKTEAKDEEIGFALILDAELFRLEAAIRWLDAAEARIGRLPDRGTEPRPSLTPERKKAGV